MCYSERGTARTLFGLILTLGSVANFFSDQVHNTMISFLLIVIGVAFTYWGIAASKGKF